ncbi:putative nucleic acid-binding protein [Sphaerotilus hippei]|uniref:Putative nucleic acid-binding protein n=1 Tax=Sphaerotilus hippei TaxID=744406 RepID=A0A318H7K3_9BURK|nr:PIN domain-containing protein [Sphaerotilus hippei]PXW98644.1 putative nucleic acid-binding protein [Sphaerotilus hippei]
MSTTPATLEADDIILDTNVVLDWLVFEQAQGRMIGQQVRDGRLRWIVSDTMHDELIDVLGRLLTLPSLMRWQHRHADALAAVEAWSVRVAEPRALPLPRRLHCTDPDDQVFINLALDRGTRWLLSRDHALLRLARRARLQGVEVLTPERWAATAADHMRLAPEPLA